MNTCQITIEINDTIIEKHWKVSKKTYIEYVSTKNQDNEAIIEKTSNGIEQDQKIEQYRRVKSIEHTSKIHQTEIKFHIY